VFKRGTETLHNGKRNQNEGGQLARNLKSQTKIYERAGDARRSITVIMYFSAEELARVQRVLRDVGRDADKTIVLIDAREDNKPSGSKA
jgi:hypothetical protein